MLQLWRHQALLCGWLFTLLANCVQATAPSVEITNLPPFGSSNDLGGRVLNAEPSACRVAVFIYVPSYGWVTKPTCAQPLTIIQPDGSWTADITTGGIDELATRIAALLVRTNYGEACVTGVPFLPTNVFAQALASAVITRQHPGVRWLNFLGYDWWVKASSEKVGPGPNYFSDSTNNVWLDGQGRLHLRITSRSNEWQCAEIVSARTFGFGSYRFQLDSRLDNLDTNVVLRLFTWSDDPAYTYREIDIERWCRDANGLVDGNNGQFVVQPWYLSNHLARFAVPAAATNSTHLFAWEPNRVSFQSRPGCVALPPYQTNVIKTWVYTLDVPPTGDENVRLNLWLYQGNPPGDGQEAEAVVSSFEFSPLGKPFPPIISSVGLWGTNLMFVGTGGTLNGTFCVLASTNLSLPVTN